jgi:hypothetical protein
MKIDNFFSELKRRNVYNVYTTIPFRARTRESQLFHGLFYGWPILSCKTVQFCER